MGLDRVARALPEGAGRVRRGTAGPTRGRGRQATPGRGMTPFDDHRPGIFKRLLVGAALVIFAAAGATAVAAFREVDRVVNAIGCVYADVDRRYYNNSASFAYINLPPGYQRMCGRQALQYVRYRHEDTDLVRSARQQDFMRQAKQQIGVGGLIAKRDR